MRMGASPIRAAAAAAPMFVPWLEKKTATAGASVLMGVLLLM